VLHLNWNTVSPPVCKSKFTNHIQHYTQCSQAVLFNPRSAEHWCIENYLLCSLAMLDMHYFAFRQIFITVPEIRQLLKIEKI